MSKIILEIAINVIATVFAWVVIGLFTLYLTSIWSRKRFLKFFGLTKRKKVLVYFSNLWDPNSAKMDRPSGTILSGHEFQASQTLGRLFGSSPFSMPDLVRGFVDAFWIGRKCEVFYDVSPMDDQYDRNNNLIVVGSTLKNLIRRIYMQKDCIHVVIEGEPKFNDKIDIHSNQLSNQFLILLGERKGEKISRIGEYELGIIEKIREPNRTIFFCLGRTGYGTRAVAEYFARNWQAMWRDHQDRCFARCLWFPKHDPNKGTFVDWEPIYHEDVYYQCD